MKRTCIKCNTTKAIEEFRTRKGIEDNVCKTCVNTYNKQHYKANKADYFKRNKRYKAEVKQMVRDYKEAAGCADCKLNFPYYVLEFDHLPGYEKKFNISDMVNGSLARQARTQIIEEMSKCEVLCANCHRVRTFSRMKKD